MKNKLDDLAILGGPREFSQALHVGRPNIGNQKELIKYVNDILSNKWLTNYGPYVQEFERQVERLLGVKNCIAVCNATIGLEILIRALGLSGEVIIPSFTFVATAHALQWLNIKPVFCDIDPETHNVDVRKIEPLINSRTTGIIGVHLWGRPCPVEDLNAIAQKYDFKLMYDAAHAFGNTCNGTMIGNFGCAEVFSFHATKFINTFEGGIVATNNDELAAKIRLMSNFGFTGYDDVSCIGTNGKMNEVSAAMGLVSLKHMQAFVDINYKHYLRYQAELEDVPGVLLLEYNAMEKNNYQYIVLEIDEAVTCLTRDHLIKVLHAENIIARRYFYPGCHKMEPYRTYYPDAKELLPETEKLVNRVLVLPTGTSISKQDIKQICNTIRLAVNHGHLLGKMFAN